jgi:dihydrofolate reductase
MRDFILITAMDFNNAIGRDNKLLCHLGDDMKGFRSITDGQTIVMGRETYESIGKPLPNRVNVVLTRDKDFKAEGVTVFHHPAQVLDLEKASKTDIFIIGGGGIYKLFLPVANFLAVTRIEAFIDDTDTFFPEVNWDEWEHDKFYDPFHIDANENNDYPFTFYMYYRK